MIPKISYSLHRYAAPFPLPLPSDNRQPQNRKELSSPLSVNARLPSIKVADQHFSSHVNGYADFFVFVYLTGCHSPIKSAMRSFSVLALASPTKGPPQKRRAPVKIAEPEQTPKKVLTPPDR